MLTDDEIALLKANVSLRANGLSSDHRGSGVLHPEEFYKLVDRVETDKGRISKLEHALTKAVTLLFKLELDREAGEHSTPATVAEARSVLSDAAALGFDPFDPNRRDVAKTMTPPIYDDVFYAGVAALDDAEREE